jgi:chromosome segregation ATPase
MVIGLWWTPMGEPAITTRQHLDQALADLRKARQELEGSRSKVERLEGRVEALRDLMREFSTPSDSITRQLRIGGQQTYTHANGSINWQSMPRSQAIMAMLRREKRPMGPAELSRALKAEGREKDEPNYISSTLDNLKRRQKVASIGEGRGWVIADQSQTLDAEKSQILPSKPEGGGST